MDSLETAFGQALPASVREQIKAYREGQMTGVGSTDGTDDCPPLSPSCSVCQDVGLVVRRDLPRWDPAFGKTLPCPACPLGEERRIARFFRDAQVPREFHTLTFDSYPATRATAGALAEVRSWVTAPVRPSLYLFGGYGTGKTGLALCAMQARAARDQCGCLFLTTPTLLDRIRATYDDRTRGTEAEVMGVAKEVRLLVLDDLGAESEGRDQVSAWVTEKLFTLINHRHDWGLPTIFTSNLHVKDLKDILTERTMWRIAEMAQTVHLAGPNLRREGAA